MVKIKYSFDRMYRYQIVVRESGIFQVWVEKKIFDSYMGKEWSTWSDIPDLVHLTDSIESAIKIGSEGLISLCGRI